MRLSLLIICTLIRRTLGHVETHSSYVAIENDMSTALTPLPLTIKPNIGRANLTNPPGHSRVVDHNYCIQEKRSRVKQMFTLYEPLEVVRTCRFLQYAF